MNLDLEAIRSGNLPPLLKAISQMSDVIGILACQWEQPLSHTENTVMQALFSIRETIRREHEAQQQSKPTIVCLCGSTRFADAFHEWNLRETLAGRIVLSIGCNTRSDADLMLAGELTEDDKVRLDELHKRKIDLCDEILVLNVGGYVGPSTQSEIAYARAHGKPVRWLEE